MCWPTQRTPSLGLLTQVTTSKPYHLASAAFVCATAAGYVILDLPSNSYLALDAATGRGLELLVDGWPKPAAQSAEAAPNTIEEAAEALIQAGVIATVSSKAPWVNRSKVSIDGPLSSIGEELGQLGSINFREVFVFLYVLITVALDLRFRRFYSVIRRTADLKSHLRQQESDYFRAIGLVQTYRRLRVYAFRSDGHCLFHALTLVRFLSYYGIDASFVIGVRTDPWGAHSWAQRGNVLLDTSPEKVCAFQPILCI